MREVDGRPAKDAAREGHAPIADQSAAAHPSRPALVQHKDPTAAPKRNGLLFLRQRG
jgi:hypothetical protein